MRPLVHSLQELLEHEQWFVDPTRSAGDNAGPHVLIIDDFYPNALEIRDLAIRQQFIQYEPPLASQVGPEIAEEFRGQVPGWYSSSLLRFFGKEVRHPIPGFRYAPIELLNLMSARINEQIGCDGWREVIRAETWDEMGDWWNGAFHLQNHNRGPSHTASIHHHFKIGDVTPRGWSGVVYLSLDSPKGAGTRIWLDAATKLCVAPQGAKFDFEPNKFQLAFEVENKFNRLMLVRENVLHQAGYGFGVEPRDARLTQSFFFLSDRVRT
jgi:hypothetical protein